MRIFLVALLCIFSTASFTSFTIFKTPKSSKLTEDQITSIANNVLSDLKIAKGILPTEPPSLRVKTFQGSADGVLASFDRFKNEILLDTKSYNIMRRMGKDSLDALAFLLGHELGHYIHSHRVVNHNITHAAPGLASSEEITKAMEVMPMETTQQEFKQKLDAAIWNYDSTHEEAEADFEGGFLGYLAGYEPMAAGKEFLRKAYDHPFMNLTKETPGYPSFDERLEVIENTTKELETLIPIFEMANYLIAIEQYYDAIPYLERVLDKFQSREVYNNIGVATILEILTLFEEPLTEYKFPLSLDANFRLPHPNFSLEHDSGGFHDIRPEEYVKFLKCHQNRIQKEINKAENYFEKAIYLDPDYGTAYLNLSIAQSIKALLYKWTQSFESNNCMELELEELSKALTNAITAKQITENSLHAYEVSSFSKLNFEDGEFEETTQTDTLPNGNTSSMTMITPKVSSKPYKIQAFGNHTFIKTNIDSNIIADSTSWRSGKQNNEIVDIPVQAFLLSNIHTQIDLIYILRDDLIDGKIIKRNPYWKGNIKVVPFAQALEINPKNKLASYNLHYARTNTKLNETNIQSNSCQTIAERFKGHTVSKIYADVTEWDTDFSLPSSKIFVDNDNSIFEDPSTYNYKYNNTSSHELFVNKTEIKKDFRTEQSVILAPKSINSLQTECDIKAGTSYDEMVQTYGPPTKLLTLSVGSYATYVFTRNQIFSGSVEQTVLDELGNESVQLKQFAVAIEDDIPQPFPVVEKVSTQEEGLIIKLDKNNNVIEWAIYHRDITTRNTGSS